MPSCRYVEEISLVTILAAKSLVGVTPVVDLRECVNTYSSPRVNKASHSGLESQRRHH